MEVLRYARKTIVTARIISRELWLLPTHWSELARRTMICPATAVCCRCQVERPKVRGYAIAQMAFGAERPQGLIELAPEVCEQLQCRGLEVTNAAGWTFKMEKRSERPGWKVLAAEQVEIQSWHTPAELAAAIETLYGLPLGLGEDRQINEVTNLRDWQVSHAQCLDRRIQADLAHERSRTP
jgi:hypothetical protein